MLKDVTSNCYQARWLEQSFTNWEQINLCKAEMQEKYFGKFTHSLQSYRDSTRFRFQECEVAAGNNVEKAVLCVRGYLKSMEQDNEKLIELAK
jgi:hypothetical protein